MGNKNRQPCMVDLLDRRNVIVRFRDLANVGPLLDVDLNEELSRFRVQLKDVGWGEKEINEMEIAAYAKTRYGRGLPHLQSERGDYREYMKDKGRRK